VLAFQNPVFFVCPVFLYVTKKLSAVFFAGFACKKTLGQFFPSFACFAHKKLSAESRPSAESSLVAEVLIKNIEVSEYRDLSEIPT
jgi:hypothetical protein